jgi:hypothetical protein
VATREIFLTRVGTIILALMICCGRELVPAPPPDATGPRFNTASRQDRRRARVIFAPLGFNWQISIALVPVLAAREVAVGALGTVYSLAATGDDVASALHTADQVFVVAADRAFAARVVRVRAAVPVDARDRQARDELVALSADHGGLLVRARLCGVVRDVQRRGVVHGESMSDVLSNSHRHHRDRGERWLRLAPRPAQDARCATRMRLRTHCRACSAISRQLGQALRCLRRRLRADDEDRAPARKEHGVFWRKTAR